MLSDEVFEREKRAYRLIQRSMVDMLHRGYEVRWFDNVPRLELDLLFVGPSEGSKTDVQKLVLPYQFLSLLCEDDKNSQAELNYHLGRVQEASRQLHSFLHETILKKLEVRHGGSNAEGQA